MRKALMINCILLFLLTTCSQPRKITQYPAVDTNYTVQINEREIPYYLELIQEEIILSKNAAKAEKEIAAMTKDIKDFWIYYYNKKAWPIREKHYKAFDKYSKELAQIVYYFKRNESSLGGKLPDNKDTHIFIAMMVAKETAVNPYVRGKLRNEVGLLQVHGAALLRHKPKEVLENPKLGLFLGVNWIASKFQTCWKNTDENNWDNTMWYYPITIYAAGEGKGRAYKGKCQTIGVARTRINMTIRYLDKQKKV